MVNIRAPFRIFAAPTSLLTISAAANAQATRTWVSGVGDDLNPCSRTAPCKTYAGAISKTAVHGEISTLDPGGHGTVTVTKSITIEGTAGQGYGSVLSSLSSGVTVNYDNFTAVGGVQKTVRLRNINGSGGSGGNADSGLRGVRIIGGAASAGSEVFVEDCVIEGNFANPGRGIEDVRPGGGKPAVTNTTVRNMLGTGIVVIPAGGATRTDAAIDNMRVHNCGFGVEGPGGAAEMHVADCRIPGNATGTRQDAGGTMRVGNSDIAFSTANGASGTVLSYGNNRFAGNGGVSSVTAIGVTSNEFGQQ